MKNIGIHFNRLQFVTNWIFDSTAPTTAERGERDNIRTRVSPARDQGRVKSIQTDTRSIFPFLETTTNIRDFLGSSYKDCNMLTTLSFGPEAPYCLDDEDYYDDDYLEDDDDSEE